MERQVRTRPKRSSPLPSAAGPGGAAEVKFDALRTNAGRTRGSRRAGPPQSPARASKTQTVQLDERVIVTVAVPKPGRVELDGLGRLQTTAPGTPAVFDLFTDRLGRFPVLYTPAEGDDRVVGTLVVERARDGQAS